MCANVVFILRGSISISRGFDKRILPLILVFRSGRDRHKYLSSLIGLRFDRHIAFMAGDDRFDNRKSQPVPGVLRGVPAAVETFKEVRLVFERDSNPRIADA